MKKKPIVVGFDFDGVVAYNPFRIARLPVTLVKKKFFGAKGTKFYIPKTSMEKFIWTLLHESSVFPAHGTQLLRELVTSNQIEAHLVTARYSFLQKSLYKWLDHHKLTKLFTTITMNEKDEQPHVYKARIIGEKKFDYFIEDNFDIVAHVSRKYERTTTYWIYNILDRNTPYPYKFPYLKKAIEGIIAAK